MAEPISVAARRGEIAESVHRVHAVAVKDGRVVETAGNPGFVTFMRSAAKPLQALPLARAREDLDERDLAIASASHLASDEQLEAVRALLGKAQASEDDLECGPFEGSRLKHNCSGKHAGMLALCQARSWPKEGYRLPGHPVQRESLAAVAEAAGAREDEIPTAVDGCGVVTFALALDRIARAFGHLAQVEAGDRVAAAMQANPELIRGPGAVDTELMRSNDGWTAKGGAEGFLGAAGPDGLALAIKVEDGNPRALRPALAVFLERLGLDPGPFGPTEVRNSRDEVVGLLATI